VVQAAVAEWRQGQALGFPYLPEVLGGNMQNVITRSFTSKILGNKNYEEPRLKRPRLNSLKKKNTEEVGLELRTLLHKNYLIPESRWQIGE